MDFDELVSKWAQDMLTSGPLAQDSAAHEQVINATLDLRKLKASDIDKWFDDSFMNKPPLTLNTMAVNQVRAAVSDLKSRLPEEKASAPFVPPAKPATIIENKE